MTRLKKRGGYARLARPTDMLSVIVVNLSIILAFRLWFLFLSWFTVRAFSHTDRLRGEPDSPRTVTVLIPARNEQENIRACLEAVLQQDYPILEIIVIDDASTDQTGAIVEQMQQRHQLIQLVKNNGPLPGWLGKNYALYRGAQQARGDYLLFLDADVRLSPDCLRTAMHYALKYDADMLTIFPVVICVGFWEKVIMPIYGEIFLWSLIPLVQPFKRLRAHHPSKPVAFGGFLLFKKQTYDCIGGHERVKSSIIEDVELARVVKRSGYRLNTLLGGPRLLTARMYQHLGHLWEGISKSISGLTVWQLLLGIYVCFSVFVLPWLALPLVLFDGFLSEWSTMSVWALALSALTCLVALVSRWHLAKAASMDGSYAYLQPLGGLVLMAMFLETTWRVLSGKGATWKGRRVSLDAPSG
ncbi:MAG: glycosyltransferase [Acidobacteriota bacterium]|nr:glycosyltransferase [Acidobacteriota bacterium]